MVPAWMVLTVIRAAAWMGSQGIDVRQVSISSIYRVIVTHKNNFIVTRSKIVDGLGGLLPNNVPLHFKTCFTYLFSTYGDRICPLYQPEPNSEPFLIYAILNNTKLPTNISYEQ